MPSAERATRRASNPLVDVAGFIAGGGVGFLAFVSTWWLATGGIPGRSWPFTYLRAVVAEVPVFVGMGLVPFLLTRLLAARWWPRRGTGVACLVMGVVWYAIWWTSFMVGRRVEWAVSTHWVTDLLIAGVFRWVVPMGLALLVGFGLEAGARRLSRAVGRRRERDTVPADD